MILGNLIITRYIVRNNFWHILWFIRNFLHGNIYIWSMYFWSNWKPGTSYIDFIFGCRRHYKIIGDDHMISVAIVCKGTTNISQTYKFAQRKTKTEKLYKTINIKKQIYIFFGFYLLCRCNFFFFLIYKMHNINHITENVFITTWS